MDKTKIKTIIVDVITGVALLGVVGFGYMTFVGRDSEEASVQEETLSQANDISSALIATSNDLSSLADTVNKSRAIFDNNAYRNLENFSQEIVVEPVGREYPFTKTKWKLELEALEEKTKGAASAQQVAQALVMQSSELEGGI